MGHWLISAFILLILTSCSREVVPVNLAGNGWLGYQPIYLAHDLARSGPQVDDELGQTARAFSITMMASTSAVMRALNNSLLDGAMMTLDEAIQQKARTGMDLCIAMVLDYSNGADALVINPKTFSDRGERKLRIGYEATALGGYLLSRILQRMDWRLDDIDPVVIEPTEHVDAFSSGRVDAVITFEPYLSELKRLGGKVFFSSRDIPNEIIDLLVVRRAVWTRRKDDFDRLATVLWPRGLELLRQGAAGELASVSVSTGMNQLELSRALQGIHLVGVAENRRILARELGEALAMMTRYLVDSGLIERGPGLTPCD